MTVYLSGLCVAGLGLCGGGWLVVAAEAFGGETGSAGRVNLITGAALIAVCCLSLACWSRAWRRRMRADGVLADRFPLVSRRAARRNRRALSRDVRRAAKLAEQSARGARRAARRSARAAGGGALSEDGALGVASAGDEPHAAAASPGARLNGSAINGAGPNPGERAAELISELRLMLEPLLAATGGQPALAEQTEAAAPPLPQRTPSASAFRPRAMVPAPRAESGPAPVPRGPLPQGPLLQSIVPPMGGPAADDDGLGVPIDSEEAWW